ncbi:type II toxin-antitoxin system HicA family toxin [Methanocalculus alkaliphilus]
MPFHKRELPTGTLIEILKQAGIDRDEIEDPS